MPSIYDNSTGKNLSDGLSGAMENGHRLDACVGYFNIRGWKTLGPEVSRLEPQTDSQRARVLVGMLDRPDQVLLQHLRQASAKNENIDYDGETMVKELNAIVVNLADQIVSGVPNSSDLTALTLLRDSLRAGEVIIKAYLAQRLHAKLYIAHRADPVLPRIAFVGSSNLTLAGLEGQGELNIDVHDLDATLKLSEWFDDKWENLNAVDISSELADLIDNSWINQVDPYLIHLKFAYYLSREAREGNSIVSIPDEIERELLEFQKSAVRTAARILQRNQGVMIADVVGLGKTLTATALARVMEQLENAETLIICPKNLEGMWNEYVRRYQLRGRVLPLSMAAVDLKDLGRYRLVIIDESHNLRNSGGQRYNAVKEYIDKNEPRVVMLTATPYNVDLSDIADQLALFLSEDDVLPVRPDAHIADVGGLAEFNRITKGLNPNTLAAFRKSEFAEDWRTLLQFFLVRRTRGFVKKHYASEDEKGRHFLVYPTDPDRRLYFPKRIPMVLKAPENSTEEEQVLAAVDLVAKIKLARQGLGNYLLPETQNLDDILIRDLRNQTVTLQGLTRTNLVKRRSSSAAAYSLSLQRHIIRDMAFIYALDSGNDIPIGAGTMVESDLGGIKDEEISQLAGEHKADGALLLGVSPTGIVGVISTSDAELLGKKAYERVTTKRTRRLRWVSHLYLDVQKLRGDLQHDVDLMFAALAELSTISAANDSKIDLLHDSIIGANPEEKVLIFTEYQDTADYVAAGLKTVHAVVNLACVNGQSNNIQEVVRAFSPISNASLGGLPSDMQEINVLVTTDVLSEGQNLQDARIVANFDLPWALIRLVQRAGRVDRLGQESDEVHVYVLDTSKAVDTQIGLRQRLQKRLIEAGAVLGADDRFFGSENEAQDVSDLLTGNNAALEKDDTNDVDPASYAYEIWREAIEADPTLHDRVIELPLASRSTISANTFADSGKVLALMTISNVQDSAVEVDPFGNFEIISPTALLGKSKCAPGTPALTALIGHLDFLQLAADGALGAFDTGTVALAGTRRSLYERIRNEQRLVDGHLYTDLEAKQALQAVFDCPLTETAKSQFALSLKSANASMLIDQMVALYREGQLVVEAGVREPGSIQIVASMGLSGGK
jgi:superfamily II DNA or RNA helicase